MREVNTKDMTWKLAGTGTNTLSMKGNVFTARRGFFYTHGFTAEKYAELIKKHVKEGYFNRYTIQVVEAVEIWKDFKGGAPVAKQSHWKVVFRLIANREDKVEVTNIQSGLKCTIDACDVGGPCDPSTETYHSM